MSELCNRAIGRELGEGAHGRIFAVSENNVLKIVNDKSLIYKDALDFIIPRMFNHPNIVRSEGLCISKDRSSIILELASTDLYYKIKKIYRDQTETFRMIFDVLCGLYALHSNGFIHLDMKVENVLVKPRDQGYMIADFGFSIYTADVTRAELDTMYFGTPDFFSPQAIFYAAQNEKQVVSFKEDIWGFFISLIDTIFYKFSGDAVIPRDSVMGLINRRSTMDDINIYYLEILNKVQAFAQQRSIRSLLFLVEWCRKIVNIEDFTTLDVINHLLTIQPHLACNVSQITWATNYLINQEDHIDLLSKSLENLTLEENQAEDIMMEPMIGPDFPSAPSAGPSTINQIKPCGPRAPRGYSKDELIQMAVQYLGLTKYKANKLRVADLCKLLFGEQ